MSTILFGVWCKMECNGERLILSSQRLWLQVVVSWGQGQGLQLDTAEFLATPHRRKHAKFWHVIRIGNGPEKWPEK